VTAKKAEEKAASGSLLAKLHYGVVQFLDEAELVLKGNSADLRDITGKLKVTNTMSPNSIQKFSHIVVIEFNTS